jgi:transcriptional regulator with XRE-family HTH domain
MLLSEKIQMYRKKSGLSQEELAEKLDVSRQSVSKWEQGQALPEMSKLLLLSEIFGVSIDFLLKDTLDADPGPGEFPACPPSVPEKSGGKGTLLTVAAAAVLLAVFLLFKGFFNGQQVSPQPVAGFPADLAALRGEIFDCAIKNRFDYVPFFGEEEGAPADATEYLFFAFAINLDDWGDDKGTMTKSYVEGVAKEHFGVTSLEHGPMWKGWDFDGEKYVAVPCGIKDPPIYVLEKYSAYQDEEGRVVYEVTARYCTYLDIAVSGDEELAIIRQLIVSNDTKKLNTIQTEFFRFYMDDKGDFDKYNDVVVFLEHKLCE